MSTIIREVHAMQEASRAERQAGRRIAVVPTMGALHEGHLSLVRLARTHAERVITTIFVNPTQFAPGEDLERYPRPFERDVERATTAGTHFIFAPPVEELYPAGFATSVAVEGLTRVLEGAARPTHFRGVTTIVAKLFLCTLPDVAVFGQKDGQQVAVIRRMAADLNFPVRIVVGPTVREANGLAMSSRNVYLSARERSEAPVLYRALRQAEEAILNREKNAVAIVELMKRLIGENSSGLIDYCSLADAGTLVEQEQLKPGSMVMLSLAVRFGSTRLIDNIVVEVPKPNS